MTPDEFTNEELQLDVGDGHQLYVHDWGNSDAKTVIVHLHGGPGGGSSDRNKNLYDPVMQRVIFHDQRGCGKSLPYGSLDHNDIQHLVADIAKILDQFNLERVVLFGNSWGSTLALAFALAHPDRVKGMVIAGVYTSRRSENDWLESGSFQTFFPDTWARYLATVPESQLVNPTQYHFQQVQSGDPESAKKSAFAYSQLEGSAAFFDDRPQPTTMETFDPVGTLIEIHYLVNKCFMPENHIFDYAEELQMPVHIVQGRYDMVCPPVTAFELNQKLSDSTLTMTLSGHVYDHESWNCIKTRLRQLCKEDA